jgi:putative membrane protein
MMFWYGNGMSGWGYVLMTVGMLLFWGLVILGVVVLVRYLARPIRVTGPAEPRPTPEQILAERLALGEIAESEYESRLTALHESPQSTPGPR